MNDASSPAIATNGRMAASEKNPFVWEAAELKHLAAQKPGVTIEECLVDLVQQSTLFARPTISNFRVAAIGLGTSGRAYLGVNLEFFGLPLNNSVHAEQFAICNAIINGEESLHSIVVTHAPCGHCRQFMSELRSAGNLRIVIVDKNREARTLADFLPHRFGPQDLLQDHFPHLMENPLNGLELTSSTSSTLRESSLSTAARQPSPSQPPSLAALLGSVASSTSPSPPPPPRPFSDSIVAAAMKSMESATIDHPDLISLALEAANLSHSPYTKSPSGVALRTSNGTVCSGSYLESAAFNPGLPALQSALVNLVCSGPKGEELFADIVEVAVVEREGAAVQCGPTVRLLMHTIAPKATVTVAFAKVGPNGEASEADGIQAGC
eukprot:TRINITY_DN18818_c0_g1_i1.p1 TRINITY_DN18818_c0_g1~~TRINITY_DN18818_c0_g1_i1.p1  ORF type:complete len:381 (-),score=60.19 TRINITY_DN18818_c0_g1_i1:924-2066(-)